METREAPAKQATIAPKMKTPTAQAKATIETLVVAEAETSTAPVTQTKSALEENIYHEIYPNRKRITRTMCQLLADNGLLNEKFELIDGVIILKMPMNPPHRIALTLLHSWLISVFGFFFVQTEKPVALPGAEGEITQPQPDAAVTLAPTTSYTESNPGPQDVSLVVEVSDTTLRLGLTTKALLYARVGIPEYWVMDVNDRCLHRHRQPTAAGYEDIVILCETESVSPLNRAESALISALLPALRSVVE
jgi:Uma2 family endonuclease